MNTLYDSVALVSDKLKNLGHFDLVNELNNVCDELDRLDSVLENAQKTILKVREKMYGDTFGAQGNYPF